MATTPQLRTPQTQGGTFYTFSSAARDLSRTLNNENIRLVFSKFACLNIPDFDKLDFNSFSNFQNYMQFDTIDGAILAGGLNTDPNINWTQSLQSYALNFEELILSGANYDNVTNLSVSERIFFKWLKETGAIRFRPATNLERSGNSTQALYTEEDEVLTGTTQYRRVVKYLGDIDIVNNVNKGGESYTEVYINIPTEVGNTPTVLFDTIEDNNYFPGLKLQGSSEFIEGRNSSSSHPQGLTNLAFYDYDEPLLGAGSGGYTDPNANWMNEPTPPVTKNTYFTEPNSFDDSTNVNIRKYPADYNSPAGFSGSAYRRSNLDGITIDFTANDYQQIVSDPTLSTIQQFNGSDLSSNFEFNAVLIYYDVIDLNDSDNNSTNLYGILLLDNITPTTDGGFIQRVPVYKPNKITGQNGNGFGFKLNLRFDASPGTSGIDTIVNDYNTFSMALFADAVAQLQESAKIFQDQQILINDLTQRVQDLENTNSAITAATSLQDQINSLQSQLNSANAAFAEGGSLLDLIAKNSDDIQKIANNEISTTLQYNTDVVQQGLGITVDKTVPNKITISLKNQSYNIMPVKDLNGDEISTSSPLNINVARPEFFTELQPYTNMLRLDTENTAGGDLLIYIDDSAQTFSNGQAITITFNNEISIGSRNIRIFSDSLNRLGAGAYGTEIINISNSDISNKPIFEITCLDNGLLQFSLDVVK